MKRALLFLVLPLLVAVIPGFGFCESNSVPSAVAVKPSTDAAISFPHSSQGEKAAVQPGKNHGATAQLLEMLSNAVSSEYAIGAEDVLEITVWRNQDLSKQVQVRPDGKISMPVVRDLTAVGKTPNQLAEEMTNRLKEYVQNPVVAVSVKEVNSSNIFVLGEITRPGKYPLKSKTTLLQGISIAGGFTPSAARNQIVIFRFTETAPGMKRLTASYDDIVLRGGIAENFELKSGDTLVVPSESMVVFPGR